MRPARLRAFAAVTVLCLAGVVLAAVSPWFLLFLAPLVLFGYITLILALTVYRLSPRGGAYQHKIHSLIAHSATVPPGGRVLDIGCGSGGLTVAVAQARPTATVTGVDSWAGDWAYSQDQCVRNARLAGVGDRVAFDQQNGAALAFGDHTFDAVVSCLTFHEMTQISDKVDGVAEALRVVRPGGSFVFVDLFGDKRFYPDPARIREVAGAEPRPLADLMPLPYPLRHPKVLGHAMVLSGASR
ncbi:class I SAM-dependent methyltransferase [Actinoplanes sp. CA-030573]|uniref:class I SAM-dependent methyltransferase n=1 Tax=Actinoplanes sp. CA-030573 TaxID=3239898 RepID=UPI003D8B593B